MNAFTIFSSCASRILKPIEARLRPKQKLTRATWGLRAGLTCTAIAAVAGFAAESPAGKLGAGLAAKYVIPVAKATNPPAWRTFTLPSGMPGTNASVLLRMDGAWQLHRATELTGAKVKIPDGMAAVVAEPIAKQALSHTAGSGNFVLNDGRQSWEMRYEFFADPAPATWQPASGRFETDVHVAVFPKQGGTIPLTTLPVEVAGVNAEADPDHFVFTGPGKYQIIRVTTRINDDEASINLAPFTTNAPFILPVRRFGGLRLASSALSIRGYGLGTATLTATRVDTKSKDLAEGPKLDLHATSDRPLAQNISIAQGQSTVAFKVRSTGLGQNRITISAGSDATKVESLSLEYYFPGAYILATLLGGIVGACARFLESQTWQRERILRFVCEGLVAAILATAAVLAGISSSLVPAQVGDTELGAFLISASVAFTGIVSVLFLKKLGPKPESCSRTSFSR